MVTKKIAPAKKTPSKTQSKAPVRRIAKRPLAAKTAVLVTIEAAVADEPPVEKQKLVRDSFTIPKREFEVLALLKQRLNALARPTKKGELLRAGIATLAGMSDAKLLAAVSRIPSLKTGRPKEGPFEVRKATPTKV